MSFLLLAKRSSQLSRLRSLLTLAGAATAGACPDERATVHAAGAAGSTLQVRGADSVFGGLELTSSDPIRTTSSNSSYPRPNTVVSGAAYADAGILRESHAYPSPGASEVLAHPLPSVRAPPPVGWSSSREKSTGTESHVIVVSVAQQQ